MLFDDSLYVQARRLQNKGHPRQALPLWRQLTQANAPNTALHVEGLHQEAVCLRLLGQLDDAEQAFARASTLAKHHPDIAIGITLDWSALMLMRGQRQKARLAISRVILGLPPDSPRRAMGIGYLGRVYGLGSSPSSRHLALHHLHQSARGLKHEPRFAAQYLNTLIWTLEVRSPWRFIYLWRVLAIVVWHRQWRRGAYAIRALLLGAPFPRA